MPNTAPVCQYAASVCFTLSIRCTSLSILCEIAYEVVLLRYIFAHMRFHAEYSASSVISKYNSSDCLSNMQVIQEPSTSLSILRNWLRSYASVQNCPMCSKHQLHRVFCEIACEFMLSTKQSTQRKLPACVNFLRNLNVYIINSPGSTAPGKL